MLLARWLALGIEFELAADIIRTMIAPTRNDIGQLAGDYRDQDGVELLLGRETQETERRPETVAQPVKGVAR